MDRTPFRLNDHPIETLTSGLLLALLVMGLVGCASVPVVRDATGASRALSDFGIATTDLSPQLAEDIGLSPGQLGVLVLGVSKSSAAAAAGLRGGDIITGIKRAGQPLVATPGSGPLFDQVGEIEAGKTAEISVLRGGAVVPIAFAWKEEPFGSAAQPSPRAEPRTIKVAAAGGGDARTLPGALLKARPGDTILLAPGQYAGACVLLDKVTLRSEISTSKAALTYVDLKGTTGVKLADLEVVGTPAGATGIYILGGKGNTVEGCWVHGCLGGIKVEGSKETKIQNNRIEHNVWGLFFGNADFDLRGNLVLANNGAFPDIAQDARGVDIANSLGTVANNTILHHRVPFETFAGRITGEYPTGVGIVFRGESKVSIESNIVSDNNVGIYYSVPNTARYRMEYNDVFQNATQGKVGNDSYSTTVAGPDWNFVSGLNIEVKEAPLLSLDSWRHYFVAPVTPAPSQTNVSMDPLFNDLVRDDYRLATDSPLVGRGRNGTHIGALVPASQQTGEGDFQ